MIVGIVGVGPICGERQRTESTKRVDRSAPYIMHVIVIVSGVIGIDVVIMIGIGMVFITIILLQFLLKILLLSRSDISVVKILLHMRSDTSVVLPLNLAFCIRDRTLLKSRHKTSRDSSWQIRRRQSFRRSSGKKLASAAAWNGSTQLCGTTKPS